MSAFQPVNPATSGSQVGTPSSVIPLKYPQSVQVYQTYAEAQAAVDYLSDQKFPVQNLAIVGTDLKSVERVLGRRGWPQVIAGGAASGVFTGVLIGLLMSLLYNTGFLTLLLTGIVIGVAFGILAAVMAYLATSGRRDFASVQAIVATRYEVLGEHNVVQQARDLLQQMPGARAQQFGA